MPASVTFLLRGGFGSGCKQAIGMATEKILPAPPPLKRKPCCLVVSLGNGSHRLLLYLTASRLALQPSLFFMAVAVMAVMAARARMPLAIAAAWETNLWPMEHSTLQWFKLKEEN